MLVVSDLTKRYGKTMACDHVSFTLEPGTVTVLLGPNGAGKSTAMKSIIGFLKYEGSVAVDDFLRELGGTVCHMHLSDYTAEKDCVPPGEGLFDFAALFEKMRALDYRGDYVVELYRHSYSDQTQILRGCQYLNRLPGGPGK